VAAKRIGLREGSPKNEAQVGVDVLMNWPEAFEQ